MIEAQHLTKDYGTVLAVSDVSFRVGKGEIVGFLGPNGAGKSTTLRMLAGFLGPTSGSVSIDGIDIQEKPHEAKRRIGYMPEAAPLYPELRVNEYLDFRAALKGVARRERREAVRRVMDSVAIADVADTIIDHLSKGYRQRVGLADALLASPPLLILDEPTAGLDPNQIRDVRKLIRELGKTHTILLSTHILSEVEAVCDRAIVVDRGKLVAEGTLAELTAVGRGQRLLALVRDPSGVAPALAGQGPSVKGVATEQVADGLMRITVDVEGSPEDAAEELCRRWVAAGVGVRALTASKTSLEEVFTALTAADAAATAPGEAVR